MLHMQVRRLARKIALFSSTAAVIIATSTTPSVAAGTQASTAEAGKGAEATSAASARDLSLTIYTDNVAQVQDHRTVRLTGGRQQLQFDNVSAQIRSDTVSLAASGDLTIIEQNFDYDRLTPARLLQKAIGHEVTLVRTNSTTGAETRDRALVMATVGGVVLRSGDHLEVLHDDGLPVRVIFDDMPANLHARPTLSITVNGRHRGSEPVVLSYQTPGLGWHADYVALYDQNSSTLDVQGWVTLTNTSGTTYENATTTLVANIPDQDTDTDGEGAAGHFKFNPWGERATLRSAGTESGTRERLGDDYLFPLAGRTTIADQQTKQLTFLDAHGVPAAHGYEFRNGWRQESQSPSSARTCYFFSTGTHGGLGDQLPAGTLRMYLRDSKGDPQFIGESKISVTPMGSTLSLTTGDAFDVMVKPIVVARTTAGPGWRTDMSYELTNALPDPVHVVLQQDVASFTRVVSESQPSHAHGSFMTEWLVEVPANGTATVTASYEGL